MPVNPPPAAPRSLDVDTSHLIKLYAAGEYSQLSGAFLQVFDYFTRTIILNTDTIRDSVTPFLKVFFTLFTQPDYLIPTQHVVSFIAHNPLISNLTAMTPFRSTDPFLEVVLHQPANFVKILTLYSARNTMRIDRRPLFGANPELASLWYNLFCEIYKTALSRADVVRNLTEHLSYHDERMTLGSALSVPFFSSTYVDGTTLDRTVKPFLNRVVRNQVGTAALGQAKDLRPPTASHPPARPKIAVISDYWYPQHSVYRNYAAFVKELRDAYHLTLFHTQTATPELDAAMFDEVQHLEIQGGLLHLERLLKNDFRLVYFPDVGMTLPSILLANQRLAPIQICSPGHSVSTWGANIDYFMSGADVEIKESPERNYSERLVLLPGMGAIHNRPNYERTAGLTPDRAPGGEIVINCPWSAHKICARFLATVRKVLDAAAVPVRLRIFPGVGISEHNAHFSFLQDLRAALGDGVALDVWPQLDYRQYMRHMEEADLTLDSFHFAGCNTVADSLFLRKPTVVWEGDKWYNRIGPAMLRLVGLDELICASEEEYINTALSLIRDGAKRARVTAGLQAAELDDTLFSTKHAPAFRRAVDYLIEHHEDLQKEGAKTPIVID
jgi:hypothetical protein